MSKETDHSEFQEGYERYVLEHGVLFEKKMLPMDADDRKRAGSTYSAMVVLLSIFSLGVLAMLYYRWPQTTKDQIYALTLCLAIPAGFVGILFARNKALKRNEKTTFQGVITAKRGSLWKRDDKTRFELSKTKELYVISKDFVKYSLGEIVRIEYVGNYPSFVVASPKVVPIGKLPFVKLEPSDAAHKVSTWKVFVNALLGK